jgi:glutamate synthase (NADPH) small chain
MDSRNDVKGSQSKLQDDGSTGELSPTPGPFKGERIAGRQPESSLGNAGHHSSLRQKLTAALPRQRNLAVQIISYTGLLYAVLGFYNENYLHWIDSPFLSNYSDRIAIVGFGIARIASEADAYTRKRLIFLVSIVTSLWLILPLVFGINFFNHHIFGTPWFFIYLLIVFLMGRRADCSWNCPCAGLRDTAGEPFRNRTIKGPLAFVLQNLKWVALASALPILWVIVIQPQAEWGGDYYRAFWTVHLNLFFISLLIIPLTGNRNYCRYLCPWGAMYGLIGRVGFFRIAVDQERCTPCNLCENACDMGIPLRRLIAEHGEIKVTDCVGCGRCVQVCPHQALHIEDVRDSLRHLVLSARESSKDQNLMQ